MTRLEAALTGKERELEFFRAKLAKYPKEEMTQEIDVTLEMSC